MNAENTRELLQKIAEENKLKLRSYSPLSGGDINEVFLFDSTKAKYVLKTNSASRFPGMFKAERSGLEALEQPGIIDVPRAIATGEISGTAYLLLEFKETGAKKPDFWEDFGRKMAALHRVSDDDFGLDHDNYIGSLPQYNEKRDLASRFYIEMRLQTQIEMALKKGFDLHVSEAFFKNVESLVPDEDPSLVHGDLWNGNYLVNSEGQACLIDPAVAFAPREMDLGMMKLFGGFNETMFNAYQEIFPLQPGFEERVALWQLYYLLVHLNIFGAAYKSRVKAIISTYN